MLSPTDTEGIISILAQSVCDHVGWKIGDKERKEGDAGGKCEAVMRGASSAGKGVSGALGGHRIQKREAQKAYVQ